MKVFDIEPVKYIDGKLFLLDQTRLPGEEIYEEMLTAEDVWDAIYKLKVRGAPAIGVAAAYGLCISVRDFQGSMEEFGHELKRMKDYLISSRPTAVNLEWAVERMYDRVKTEAGLSTRAEHKPEAGTHAKGEAWNTARITVEQAKSILEEEADRIKAEDIEACRNMGVHGLELLKPGMGILTHCNAGTIATAKYGTCLAPIYLGHEKGYDFRVFADETRPLLQGARLTSWELSKAGIDVTLICDNMASLVMRNGWIDAVVVGCDRMAANGDGANKIGTSGVAILAKEYGIPFYMFVPTSTIDLNTPTGDDINIELRKGEEIYKMWYREPMAPEGIQTYNPAFDVTPAKYITAVVTEKGVVYPPYEDNLKKLFEE